MPRKKKNGHATHASSASDTAAAAVDMLNVQADELRERLSGIDAQLRTVAKKRPLAVIGGALLVGYIFGRIVSR